MFLHNKRMMYTVRVDAPNPMFAKMLLEQFGGPNGELAAAMRYFMQGWNEPDEAPPPSWWTRWKATTSVTYSTARCRTM